MSNTDQSQKKTDKKQDTILLASCLSTREFNLTTSVYSCPITENL